MAIDNHAQWLAVAGVAGIGTTGFAGADFDAPTVDSGGLTGGTIAGTNSTPGVGLYHYTAISTPDSPQGRTGDQGPVAVAPGQHVATQMFPGQGWQKSGNINLTCDNAAITFAVLKVPFS